MHLFSYFEFFLFSSTCMFPLLALASVAAFLFVRKKFELVLAPCYLTGIICVAYVVPPSSHSLLCTLFILSFSLQTP